MKLLVRATDTFRELGLIYLAIVTVAAVVFSVAEGKPMAESF